jgi:hypothetical protein
MCGWHKSYHLLTIKPASNVIFEKYQKNRIIRKILTKSRKCGNSPRKYPHGNIRLTNHPCNPSTSLGCPK